VKTYEEGQVDYFEVDGGIAQGEIMDIYEMGGDLWAGVQFAEPIGYQNIKLDI